MSKGGTTSGSTEIPAWLENAAIENINKARDVSQIGYVPYYGPDVAAFSPMQQQSMQSTGNAASAFGLAPQGFDAMAGMPQAQTFAGGVQGYSSAPMYEQSLDKLFANAPAQYNAMSGMFIDPFTGARPRSGYGATQAQTSQMLNNPNDNGGGGGNEGYFDQVHADRMAGMNNGGEHYGVNREYDPYSYSMPTKDISGDGVIDYRDMSFGEDGRRDVPWQEKLGDVVFGGPERYMDMAGRTLFNMSGVGDAIPQADAFQQMNQAAARYEADQAASQARAQADAQRAIDRAIAEEDAIAAGLLENLNLSAVTTPYRAPVVTKSTVNSGGDSRGAAQRDRNSSGGGYGGGGDSYDPSGRF